MDGSSIAHAVFRENGGTYLVSLVSSCLYPFCPEVSSQMSSWAIQLQEISMMPSENAQFSLI